jgi:diguanylate cyclase (GGDEF)-like protein
MSGHRISSGVRDTPDTKPRHNGAPPPRRADVSARGRVITLVASAQPTSPDLAGRDTLLVRVLTLLNQSTDIDTTLQLVVDLVRTTLSCQMVEIWLGADGIRAVELQCSSTDGSAGSRAFAAAGKGLGVGPGPSLVGRAMKSGRGSMAPPSATGQSADRDVETVAAGIRCILTFPIRGTDSVAGVLIAFHESPGRPAKDLLSAVQVVCNQLGVFVDRARAEIALHASAMELAALASTDSLTGLKNRREFDRALRTIPRQPFAVLSLDVDGLKTTNDTEGHAAGDALLRLVGHTLGLLVRGWDVIARVGGDEFAALLPEVGVLGAGVVAERMRVAMHALMLPSGPVRVTVGWSAAPAGADPVSVWQRADEALYKAKSAGGDQVVGVAYVTGESGDIAERSYSDVITRVLNRGSLTTVFQPIVNLIDGTVLGYEALARPEGFAALDSVEAIFEAARSSGHIGDLDRICRCRAVEDAKELPPEATLFLNISASTLMDPIHGVDALLNLLRTNERAPQTVVLDLTEHELIRDYEVLHRVLAAYRSEGLRFALDDVGEGHSTLKLLAASASEYLKLGRSLTMTSARVGSRAAIDATTTFARISGATVIAEGVENEYAADMMKAAGIALGQGFGLGKPTQASAIEDVGAALVDRAALSGLRPRSAYLFDEVPSGVDKDRTLTGQA